MDKSRIDERQIKKYMNKYILRKEEDSSDNYTILENPDQELKARIQAFKPSAQTVKMGWPTKTWNIEAYEGDEVRCTQGKNVQYFPLEEVKEELVEQALVTLNKEFNIYKLFPTLFGVLTSVSESRPTKQYAYWSHHIQKLIPTDKSLGLLGEDNDNSDPTSVLFYGEWFEYDLTKCTSGEQQNITLSFNDPVFKSMCIYFLEDGTIKNRNYNFKPDHFKQENVSPASMIEEMYQLVRELGPMQWSEKAKTFYSPKFAYRMSLDNYRGNNTFTMEAFPASGMGVYKKYRMPAIKLPKVVVDLTVEQVVEKVKEFIPADFVEKFV